jgi:hypothetical protein
MPITGASWEFHVQRLGIHKSGSKTRTYGEYQVFLNGNAVAALSGNVCESPGPGENQTPASFENPRRLEQGRYPLSTQFGPHFVTIGYTTQQPENHPFPGVALTGTGNRSAILIHPRPCPASAVVAVSLKHRLPQSDEAAAAGWPDGFHGVPLQGD